MKALRVPELPSGNWLYEMKFDGYRALAFKAGREVRLVSRNKIDFGEYSTKSLTPPSNDPEAPHHSGPAQLAARTGLWITARSLSRRLLSVIRRATVDRQRSRHMRFLVGYSLTGRHRM